MNGLSAGRHLRELKPDACVIYGNNLEYLADHILFDQIPIALPACSFNGAAQNLCPIANFETAGGLSIQIETF